MLTNELAIAEVRDGFVFPDRLTRLRHGHYLGLAQQMLAIYQQGIGTIRRDLHAQVRALFQDEKICPLRRIDAFCKLLDEVAIYHRDRKGESAKLRRDVFRRAAPSHPLVVQPDRLFESDEAVIKAQISRELKTTWESISERLFADVIPYQKLLRFEGYATPAALLARYNVAQAQASLYRAQSMTVWARQDLKVVLRYAKLSRLMHEIEVLRDGEYRMQFDGPASILRATSRYGVAMAKFLPALLSCRQWRMEAKIRIGRGHWINRLCLSAEDGLKSALPAPDEFDSQIEAGLAADWEKLGPQDWTMDRESVVLHEGQKTFIPDFVFRHRDGRRVLLEIAGYWTPEYLEQKRESLAKFWHEDILLAVPASLLKQNPTLRWVRDYPFLIEYKTQLRAAAVLGRLNGLG